LAAKIQEKLDIKIKLSSGAIGELSVYWGDEKLSEKGDPLDHIVKKLQQKINSD